jgi:aerobic carbon-monoxide dehydrogenase medium subunit
VIPAPVDYVRAASLDEAFAALADPEAKVLAGGQSLVSFLKLRLLRPTLLVDIGALELGGVESRGDEVRIGALTVWDDVARAPELQRPGLRAIAECAAGIGDLQVRNRGTIGGSLAHADPASDLPAVAIALGATLRLRSAEGERTVEAEAFFLGPFTTALSPGELLTELSVPVPSPGSGSAYVSVEHPASGFALAGAAAFLRSDGTRTVAVTGIGGQPFRLPADADPARALENVEIFGDHFAPADYRRHLAAVVVQRALEGARQRAQEAE